MKPHLEISKQLQDLYGPTADMDYKRIFNDKTMINSYDTLKLRAQASVLKDVAREYPGRTIENVIANLEARIKYIESHAKDNVL